MTGGLFLSSFRVDVEMLAIRQFEALHRVDVEMLAIRQFEALHRVSGNHC